MSRSMSATAAKNGVIRDASIDSASQVLLKPLVHLRKSSVQVALHRKLRVEKDAHVGIADNSRCPLPHVVAIGVVRVFVRGCINCQNDKLGLGAMMAMFESMLFTSMPEKLGLQSRSGIGATVSSTIWRQETVASKGIYKSNPIGMKVKFGHLGSHSLHRSAFPSCPCIGWRPHRPLMVMTSVLAGPYTLSVL